MKRSSAQADRTDGLRSAATASPAAPPRHCATGSRRAARPEPKRCVSPPLVGAVPCLRLASAVPTVDRPCAALPPLPPSPSSPPRSEEQTSTLQPLMRVSSYVLCSKKKNTTKAL